MDSDLHAEHAEHAQQAQHAQHAQQAQHAQHAQQAQQAQHDYDYDAEFEDVSSEALAELDQVLTHARADAAVPFQRGRVQFGDGEVVDLGSGSGSCSDSESDISSEALAELDQILPGRAFC